MVGFDHFYVVSFAEEIVACLGEEPRLGACSINICRYRQKIISLQHVFIENLPIRWALSLRGIDCVFTAALRVSLSLSLRGALCGGGR